MVFLFLSLQLAIKLAIGIKLSINILVWKYILHMLYQLQPPHNQHPPKLRLEPKYCICFWHSIKHAVYSLQRKSFQNRNNRICSVRQLQCIKYNCIRWQLSVVLVWWVTFKCVPYRMSIRSKSLVTIVHAMTKWFGGFWGNTADNERAPVLMFLGSVIWVYSQGEFAYWSESEVNATVKGR